MIDLYGSHDTLGSKHCYKGRPKSFTERAKGDKGGGVLDKSPLVLICFETK